MKKENWIWMPHPAHFIAGMRCRFRLATYVGRYIVSTVGEMPEALLDGDDGRFVEIGCARKYETMVFKAEKSEHGCCPYEVSDHTELAMQGYNKPEDAYAGHLKLCAKWGGK